MSTTSLAASEFLRSRVTLTGRAGIVPMIRHATGGLFYALATLGAARLSPPADLRSAATRLADALGAISVALDLALTVHGELPRAPALLVIHEVSELAALAVLPAAPAVPVLEPSIATRAIAGPIARHLRAIIADEPASALRDIDAAFTAGVSVLAPPRGVYLERAIRRAVPIVPVSVQYAAPLCGYRELFARRRVDVTVVVGAPWRAGDST